METELTLNPFDEITGPASSITLNAGDEPVEIFTVPDSVSDMVKVEYDAVNEKVATVSDGFVTPVGKGKTTVATEITAKNGQQVEFLTSVTVYPGEAGDGIVMIEDEAVALAGGPAYLAAGTAPVAAVGVTGFIAVAVTLAVVIKLIKGRKYKIEL